MDTINLKKWKYIKYHKMRIFGETLVNRSKYSYFINKIVKTGFINYKFTLIMPLTAFKSIY